MKKINISEIKRRIDNYGPYTWEDPSNISGFDLAENKIQLALRYYQTHILDWENELPDEILTDYLNACLCSEKAHQQTPKHQTDLISYQQFSDALIYLIESLHSSYGATVISSHHPKATNTKEGTSYLLKKFINAYDKSHQHMTKQILNEAIYFIFTYNLKNDTVFNYHPSEKEISFLNKIENDRKDLTHEQYEIERKIELFTTEISKPENNNLDFSSAKSLSKQLMIEPSVFNIAWHISKNQAN